MTSTALAIIEQSRPSIEAAQARGDVAAANALYAKQLTALGSKTATAASAASSAPARATPAAYDVATVERALTKIERVHGADARDRLEEEYGAELPAMFAIYDSVARDYPTAYSVAEEEGLALDPSFILVVAAFGREAAIRPGDWTSGRAPPAAQGKATMRTESTVDATHEDALRTLRRQIAEAKGERDSQRANRLYQEELKLIARKQGGSKPIVGSKGRNA